MEDSIPEAESPAVPAAGLISFVVRFVYDEAGPDAATPARGWRGVVRHVQSNTERHFTRWEEAVAFIGEYVEVGSEDAGDRAAA